MSKPVYFLFDRAAEQAVNRSHAAIRVDNTSPRYN